MKIRILVSVIALIATAAQTAVMLSAAYGFNGEAQPLHAVVAQDSAAVRA